MFSFSYEHSGVGCFVVRMCRGVARKLVEMEMGGPGFFVLSSSFKSPPSFLNVCRRVFSKFVSGCVSSKVLDQRKRWGWMNHDRREVHLLMYYEVHVSNGSILGPRGCAMRAARAISLLRHIQLHQVMESRQGTQYSVQQQFLPGKISCITT